MPRDSPALNLPRGYTMSNMVSTMQKAEQWPLGKQFIQLAMRWMVPFSASIKPELEILEPGHTRGRMRDRRAVRNHLSSIHAGALFTLAETTGNLALMSITPDNGRWIVTGMDIEYQKKARGPLIAETTLGQLDWSSSHEVRGVTRIFDEQGDTVAKAEHRWRVSPR